MKKWFILLSVIGILLAGCSAEEAKTKEPNNEEVKTNIEDLMKKPLTEWLKLENQQKNDLAIEALHDGGLTKAEYHKYFRVMLKEMDKRATDPSNRGVPIEKALEISVENVKLFIKNDPNNSQS